MADAFNPTDEPEVLLLFNFDGTVKTETRNFKGKSCKSATKFLTDAFGGKVTKVEHKKEFMHNEAGPQTNSQTA